jgi:hypothetical protein
MLLLILGSIGVILPGLLLGSCAWFSRRNRLGQCPGCGHRSHDPCCYIPSYCELEYEICRCRHCRVYRILGPGVLAELSWKNWRKEAEDLIAEAGLRAQSTRPDPGAAR